MASGLFHAGLSIVLYNIGGVITGSTSGTAAGVNPGNTVFTLSVDGASGAVTLTQSENIDHSLTQTSNFPTDVQSLAANLVDLTAVATTTDHEGDSAVSAPAVFDVGSHVSFGDDGPKPATLTPVGLAQTLLTFDGGLAGGNFVGTPNGADTNGSPVIATESFSGAFALTNATQFGADGGGTTTVAYALGLHGNPVGGVASGLFHAGLSIVLYNIGGVITGSTSGTAAGVNPGNTVFTLSVDGASGAVTLTQSENIDHSLTQTSNFPTDVQSLAANLVDLTAVATTTDHEGDSAVSAPAVFDVGSHVSFGDDGPKPATLTPVGLAQTLLTFDGGLAGGNFVGTPNGADTNGSPVIATESFSGAFALTNATQFGADGGGTTTVAYALGLHGNPVGGVASGLFHAGLSIVLYNIGGVITGSTSGTAAGVNPGNTVFTLSVDGASGAVTLTQSENIDHSLTQTSNFPTDVQSLAANLVDLTAVATTTDHEGDSAVSAPAVFDVGSHVSFGDDGPKSATLTAGADWRRRCSRSTAALPAATLSARRMGRTAMGRR